MEDFLTNATLNSSRDETCEFETRYGKLVLSLIDILTFLIGQPVVTRLLGIIFTSKKPTDILNCNLALFLDVQYMMSILHVIFLFSYPLAQKVILKVVFVYAEIGGPMSLTFICMDRYVAVIYPMSYHLLKKYRCREVCAATVWLISVPTAVATPFVFEKVSFLTELVLETIPVYVMMFMTGMMVWSSIRIARALSKSGPVRDKLHPVKKRALKTVCATTTITLFCYIPVAVLQKLKVENEIKYYCRITPICIVLLSAASVVHPLFYLSTQGNVFPCFKREKKAG